MRHGKKISFGGETEWHITARAPDPHIEIENINKINPEEPALTSGFF